jgi:hypothetical protein
MDFEQTHPLAFCVFLALAWFVLSAAVLWPLSWKRLVDRLPFILTAANFFLGIAVGILPKALPGLFETLLGHSIYAHRFETDWQWINRWEFAVARVFRWGIELGAIGGLVNLLRGLNLSDRIINAIAVLVGLAIYYMSTHIGF